MTTEIVDIEYREYTTEGRLIGHSRFCSAPNLVREDVETLMDPELTTELETYYQAQGIMDSTETLKELWSTNVIVRHPGTGRFMKWKYI